MSGDIALPLASTGSAALPRSYEFYGPLGSSASRPGRTYYESCALDGIGARCRLSVGDFLLVRSPNDNEPLVALCVKVFVEEGVPRARLRWCYRATELATDVVPSVMRGKVSTVAPRERVSVRQLGRVPNRTLAMCCRAAACYVH